MIEIFMLAFPVAGLEHVGWNELLHSHICVS